jgi:hypothetical protein
MQADLADTSTNLTTLSSIKAHFLTVGPMDDENELDKERHRIARKQATSLRGSISRSLPEHVLKSLAQDIEAAGGIGGRDSRRPFNLQQICDRHEDLLYGAPDQSR